MGLLEQTRTELDEAARQSLVALTLEKNRIIQAQLAGMADLLTQPEYLGDLDHALVHYLGRAAFNQNEVKGYQALAEAIGEAEGPELPVLIAINPAEHPTTEAGANYTNLVMVEPANLVFRSVTNHRDEVKMHAFTDQVAAVTEKQLSMVAPGAAISGDLSDPHSLRSNAENVQEVVLADSVVANDNAAGHGTYEFHDRSTNYIQLNSWGEPYVVAGWQAIETEVYKSIGNHVEGLLAFRALLNAAFGQTSWKKQMPELSAQIKAAQRFQPTTIR